MGKFYIAKKDMPKIRIHVEISSEVGYNNKR